MNGKLVYGVGVYHKGEFCSSVGGKSTVEYNTWNSMLERCYSIKYHEKQPTYISCEVSYNFKNFQYFANWCNNQIGFGLKGYQLDKDIICKGNKLYSENNCVFVPSQVNAFMTNRKANRGKFMLGVFYCYKTNKYRACCKDGLGRSIHFKAHYNEIDAFLEYKAFKEALAKQLALKYKGIVDDRVIEALNSFTVELTD